MLTALWPSHWSRPQRSNATLITALLLMVVVVSLLGDLLSLMPEPIGDHAAEFAEGARTTLYLTLISGAVGLLLGVFAALARTSGNALLRSVSGAYIWIIRGTPLLVQILFMYFALPVLVPWLSLPDFAAACVALSLNVGAYNAEAVRAGLNAVPRGQAEAARALGLPKSRVFLDVVFPRRSRFRCPAGEQFCGPAQGLVAGLRDWRGGADQRGQPHPVGHLPAGRDLGHRGHHLPGADHAGHPGHRRHRVPL